MPEYDACMTGSIYPSYRVAPHGHHHYKKVYKPRYKKHGHSHGTRGFRIIVGP
jgi:hypothetical protein